MKQESLCAECDENYSPYHNVFSFVRHLGLPCSSDENSSEERDSKLQLLCKNSWKVLVSAGPSTSVAENSLRVCKLEGQAALKEIERVATFIAANASVRVLDALQVRNAMLDSNVRRLYSKVDAVKRLLAKINRSGRDAEKAAASFIGTTNMRDEAIEIAEN